MSYSIAVKLTSMGMTFYFRNEKFEYFNPNIVLKS